ncbi:MAG: hypothetical protein OHK0017_03650 [Patescibacteria group bacterium]
MHTLFWSKELMEYIEERNQLLEIVNLLWKRQYADSTGICVSQRVDQNLVLVDTTGTGYRRCKDDINDLILIDLKGDLKQTWSNHERGAPVNVIIALNMYRNYSELKACVHCHSVYSNAFAIAGKPIPRDHETLQRKLVGDVPCIIIDDRLEKQKMNEEGIVYDIPSGIHTRQDVFHVMNMVGLEAVQLFESRKEEMFCHGIAFTHFEHGLFALGRNLGEAFSTFERVERGAQSWLLAKSAGII